MENKNTAGKREVFAPFIRKNGKVIYPKNARVFHFWVDDNSKKNSNYEQTSMFDKNVE